LLAIALTFFEGTFCEVIQIAGQLRETCTALTLNGSTYNEQKGVSAESICRDACLLSQRYSSELLTTRKTYGGASVHSIL